VRSLSSRYPVPHAELIVPPYRLPGSSADWHQARVVHAEMLHFVRQLQAFYQLEVIECSWQAFEELIAKNEDGLDGLVKAHREYLGRLMTRILLVSTSRTGGTEVSSALSVVTLPPFKLPQLTPYDPQDSLLRKVQEVFQVILDFRTATVSLRRRAHTTANADRGLNPRSGNALPSHARRGGPHRLATRFATGASLAVSLLEAVV
jgi:hypothetical protein